MKVIKTERENKEVNEVVQRDKTQIYYFPPWIINITVGFSSEVSIPCRKIKIVPRQHRGESPGSIVFTFETGKIKLPEQRFLGKCCIGTLPHKCVSSRMACFPREGYEDRLCGQHPSHTSYCCSVAAACRFGCCLITFYIWIFVTEIMWRETASGNEQISHSFPSHQQRYGFVPVLKAGVELSRSRARTRTHNQTSACANPLAHTPEEKR